MAQMYPMAAKLDTEQRPQAQEQGESAQRSMASEGCLRVLLGAVQAAKSARADTDSLRGLHVCCLLLLHRLLSPEPSCSPSRDSAASQASATVCSLASCHAVMLSTRRSCGASSRCLLGESCRGLLACWT